MNNSDDGNPKPPTPEEVSRKLADFMKKNFGDVVHFSNTEDKEGDSEGVEEPEKPVKKAQNPLKFNYRPRDIKAHLDRFVIRQDETKKVLSIAVCDHYNHAKFLRGLEESEPGSSQDIEFTKQNVIVVGPTGVGKTYLIKHIADLIGVPFVKADATKFSETGYVGGDVDDLVRELVHKAEGDIDLAEHGIIYIDEVDKLASKGESMGRDVSGRGVQTTLLKLMEDTEVPLRNPMDMQSQMQAMFDMQGGKGGNRRNVRTRHILFIVSGAFSGLERIVDRRLRQGAIGFGAEQQEIPMNEALFDKVTTQDFLDYGFEAEFIGRLPVRVICEKLSAEDLFTIMTRSEGSLIRQYEREFKAFGISATFSDGALKIISERAAGENTGARGLMTVCERILRDFKFELPGTSVTSISIDENLVNRPEVALSKYRELEQRVDIGKVAEEAAAFASEFSAENKITINFKKCALAKLGELSAAEGTTVTQLCRHLFKDFQFGLNLIKKNSGQDIFAIREKAITDPDGFLSDLVVESYSQARDGQ